MFYVIDRNTGFSVSANGFWAVSNDGELFDVIDGWGCEGGGGSNRAPENFIAVFGIEPEQKSAEPEEFRCDVCSKLFTTMQGRDQHRSIKHSASIFESWKEQLSASGCVGCGSTDCNGECAGDDMMGASS